MHRSDVGRTELKFCENIHYRMLGFMSVFHSHFLKSKSMSLLHHLAEVMYLGRRNMMIMQEDLELVKSAGMGRVDITVGSALDIFGGALPYTEVVNWHRQQIKATVKAV